MTEQQLRDRLNRYRREKIAAELQMPIVRVRRIANGAGMTFSEGEAFRALFERWEGDGR